MALMALAALAALTPLESFPDHFGLCHYHAKRYMPTRVCCRRPEWTVQSECKAFFFIFLFRVGFVYWFFSQAFFIALSGLKFYFQTCEVPFYEAESFPKSPQKRTIKKKGFTILETLQNADNLLDAEASLCPTHFSQFVSQLVAIISQLELLSHHLNLGLAC